MLALKHKAEGRLKNETGYSSNLSQGKGYLHILRFRIRNRFRIKGNQGRYML